MKQVLKSGGAAREFYISDLVTHVIATDTSFPQFGEAKEYNLTIVQVLFSVYWFGKHQSSFAYLKFIKARKNITFWLNILCA